MLDMLPRTLDPFLRLEKLVDEHGLATTGPPGGQCSIVKRFMSMTFDPPKPIFRSPRREE